MTFTYEYYKGRVQIYFLQGAQILHLQKLLKDVVYRNQ